MNAAVRAMASVAALSDVRKLIETVEKSQMPLAEEEEFFLAVKQKSAKGQKLAKDEMENLMKIAEEAKEWEKSVQSSARTEREETMAG